MSVKALACVSLVSFLVGGVLVHGQTPPTEGPPAAIDYPEAVRACADALKKAPDEASAKSCAATLRPHLADVVTGAMTLLGAGDSAKALERCAAVLVLDAASKDAGTCAITARARIAAHDRDRLKLQQARALAAAGEAARAGEILAVLDKSEFSDILSEAAALQDSLNRTASARADAAGRASIEHAAALVELGKQDDAVKLLREVLASNVGQDVLEDARRALTEARPSLWRSFRESLRHPWAVQVSAILLVIAGVWIVLHWIRDIWRWVDLRLLSRIRPRSWTFAGVTGEDKLGARDPILDALRRVPHEVRRPIWTPTWLLLYPQDAGGWEVWEDFGVKDPERAKVVHEDVFDPRVAHSDGDRILSDAFQNLQFNVGPVGVGAVTKFWTGLIDWWKTGEPSFSATCQELTAPEGPKKIVLRLTSNGPGGTASVLASSDLNSVPDAVSLCAERAAYKLLFTMREHRDSAAQIDGHAAFRQGVTTLSRAVSAAGDDEKTRMQRTADINKAIHNLEIARRSFERDPEHRVYHLQALRFLGIAHVLVGDELTARVVFEELEDTADKPPAPIVVPAPLRTDRWRGPRVEPPTAPVGVDPAVQEPARRRDQQLTVEARFNQAMLYCRRIVEGDTRPGAALTLVDGLMDRVAAGAESLRPTVQVSKLLHRNNICWPDWLSFDAAQIEAIRQEVKTVDGLLPTLDKFAAEATGSDRRHYAVLGAHARRNLGVAKLRLLALELSRRGPFAPGGSPLTNDQLTRLRKAFDFIDASVLLGELSAGGRLARAYGLLLMKRWLPAEKAAAELFASKADNQFALYIAAEAALQRTDFVAARKYVQDTQAMIIEDPALRKFVDDFVVLDTGITIAPADGHTPHFS